MPWSSGKGWFRFECSAPDSYEFGGAGACTNRCLWMNRCTAERTVRVFAIFEISRLKICFFRTLLVLMKQELSPCL